MLDKQVKDCASSLSQLLTEVECVSIFVQKLCYAVIVDARSAACIFYKVKRIHIPIDVFRWALEKANDMFKL